MRQTEALVRSQMQVIGWAIKLLRYGSSKQINQSFICPFFKKNKFICSLPLIFRQFIPLLFLLKLINFISASWQKSRPKILYSQIKRGLSFYRKHRRYLSSNHAHFGLHMNNISANFRPQRFSSFFEIFLVISIILHWLSLKHNWPEGI